MKYVCRTCGPSNEVLMGATVYWQDSTNSWQFHSHDEGDLEPWCAKCGDDVPEQEYRWKIVAEQARTNSPDEVLEDDLSQYDAECNLPRYLNEGVDAYIVKYATNEEDNDSSSNT